MSGYRVPSGYGEAELIEKRSRFIGHVWPVESEEEAVYNIKKMREKHWDAAHNVYAYILREGGIMRYSDDGEPQGSSGMPALNVFRASEIFNVCCVITRYFGGVLLGTGGLARAYSQSASLALGAAGISIMRLWRRFIITCDYSKYERIKGVLQSFGGIADNTDYGIDVTLTAIVDDEDSDDFIAQIVDSTAGAVVPVAAGAEHRPIEIEQP